MRYGMPYKGSKNFIAEWIIENLPSCDTLYDLFFGGGAITHTAMLSGKWKRIVSNDIRGELLELFNECIQGEHTIEKHRNWVSREDFHEKKDTDALISLVWSFGNNRTDYLYGRNIEEIKHAMWELVVNDDSTLWSALRFPKIVLHGTNVDERYSEYRASIKGVLKDSQKRLRIMEELESLERLEVMERLQFMEQLQSLGALGTMEQLQSLGALGTMERLQSLTLSYDEVEIEPNSVIYCDPPYASTRCEGYGGFDSDKFHEWARHQDNIFISEYSMPDDFIVVAQREKRVLSRNDGSKTTAIEKLYTNRITYENHRDYFEKIGTNGVQGSLFDFMKG